MSESDDLFRAYKAYLERQQSEHRYRRVERFFTLIIVVLIAGFLAFSFIQVRSEYARENIAPHLAAEMSELSPVIADALFEVADDVIPLYIELGSAKLTEILPDLEANLQREFETVWQRTRAQLNADFDAALDRMARRLQSRLESRFPEIGTPEGLAMIEEQLHALIEDDTNRLIEEFFDKYTKDLYGVYRTLDGFRPSPYERLDQEELVLQYIHLWLTAIDHEIMGVQ